MCTVHTNAIQFKANENISNDQSTGKSEKKLSEQNKKAFLEYLKMPTDQECLSM